MISTSAGAAAASSVGPGQRFIHASQGSQTRATWVCCSMTSETSTPQAVVSGSRQGSWRALVAYQSRMRARTWCTWVSVRWSVADDIDTMVVPSGYWVFQWLHVWLG